MIDSRKPIDNGLAGHDAPTNDGAIRAAQMGATATERATQRFETLVHEGAHALQQGAQRVLDLAHDASHETRDYIERRPVRSVLMAAAAGAALMALAGWLVRSSRRG